MLGWLDSVLADVRYAVRTLLRSPVFSIVAVASLALGVGANTAVFTLMDAVMVRPLPVPHPEELVHITMSDRDRDGYFTNPLWEQVRDRQTGFAASFLFGVQAGEPAVLVSATVVLVALMAGLVPALRAARVDPVAALRED